MPHYHFHLRTTKALFFDREGMAFPDSGKAYEHAAAVARELMRNREVKARSWRLEVFEGNEDQKCFEVLFTSVDATLEHLQPDLREAIERVSSRTASLIDAIDAVRSTIYEVKATLARSRRAPYLAALRGVRVTGPGPTLSP
jgi:hypothetical protein